MDSSSLHSKRFACRGQRYALTTALTSDHLPTPTYCDFTEGSQRYFKKLCLEDTRRHVVLAPWASAKKSTQVAVRLSA